MEFEIIARIHCIELGLGIYVTDEIRDSNEITANVTLLAYRFGIGKL